MQCASNGTTSCWLTKCFACSFNSLRSHNRRHKTHIYTDQATVASWDIVQSTQSDKGQDLVSPQCMEVNVGGDPSEVSMPDQALHSPFKAGRVRESRTLSPTPYLEDTEKEGSSCGEVDMHRQRSVGKHRLHKQRSKIVYRQGVGCRCRGQG